MPRKKKLQGKNLKGFTLLELIVVIAIIGLFANIIFASYYTARQKARDVTMMSDLKIIQTALEMYYDHHGQYPHVDLPPLPPRGLPAMTTDINCGWNWCWLENALTGVDIDSHTAGNQTGPKFIEVLPRDPMGLQLTYRYYYDADPYDNYQTYALMCRFEHSSNFSTADNDRGYYNRGDGRFYEIGTQPSYCMHDTGYAGVNRNWLGTPRDRVCVGDPPLP